jgi:two-component system, chemotaxis family, chemotaxis protein CheY
VRILIVEDDLISIVLMQKLLSPYGECDVAQDGLKAVNVFKEAYVENRPFDLICLDIMMPKMDGHDVLRLIREYEDRKFIQDKNRVKIIMTTALSDLKNVMQAARGRCEAYLLKPIGKENLSEKLEFLGFSPKKIGTS